MPANRGTTRPVQDKYLMDLSIAIVLYIYDTHGILKTCRFNTLYVSFG